MKNLIDKIYYENEGYVKLIVWDKNRKISHSVLLDIIDYNRLDIKYISFANKKDKRYNHPYVIIDKGALLHREVMYLSKGDGLIVDHIDGDALNNRRNNLRIVDNSTNMRNIHNFHRNNTGVIGIQYRENGNYRYFRVSWRDLDGKRKTKQFNINKYGKEKAFELAKNFFNNVKKKNNYL